MRCVAAGILPAVESGVSPDGINVGFAGMVENSSAGSGRQDAALHGRWDARRYGDQPGRAPKIVFAKLGVALDSDWSAKQ